MSVITTGDLTDKQRHLIDRGAQRVEGIINLSKDLLDLAKIEAGTLGEMEMVEVELDMSMLELMECLEVQEMELEEVVMEIHN